VKEVEGVALESSIADGDVYSSVDVRSYEQMEAAFFPNTAWVGCYGLSAKEVFRYVW